MPELISLHIGQAGCQIGSACWELFCLEHGVMSDGYMPEYRYKYEQCLNKEDNTYSIFAETESRKFLPRALFIDLEPTVIDEIRSGTYKHLFYRYQLISGKEDAANNYARGYHGIGPQFIDLILDRVRSLTELCPSLQGFILYHSFGGGTGSGLTSLLMEYLNSDYPKKIQYVFGVHPSPKMSTSIVEPYNAILATDSTLSTSDCTFLVDNEAMYKICTNNLELYRPTYTNLNRLLAQVVSSITATLRFESSLKMDCKDIQTNLVPYPRIHYPLINYAPIVSCDRYPEPVTISDMTSACFQWDHPMLMCDAKCGKYIACCLFYRGDIPPTDVNIAIQRLKARRHLKFVKWCRTGFKVAINFRPPTYVPGGDLAYMTRALCTLSNTTAVVSIWECLNWKFDLMYAKRAFLHWYQSEGLELQDMCDARENTAALEKDYEEVNSDDWCSQCSRTE